MSNICIIEGCENVITDRAKYKTCSLCRASMYRWMKRSPSHVLERRRKLNMYDARMRMITGEEKPNYDKATKVVSRTALKKGMLK